MRERPHRHTQVPSPTQVRGARGAGERAAPDSRVRKVAFVANGSVGLYQFRRGVMASLRAAGFDVLCVAPEDSFTSLLVADGYDFELLDVERYGRNPIYEFETLRELTRIYRKHAPDLVFHYTIKPNIYGTLAAHRLGIPSVAVVTGLGTFPDIRNPLMRFSINRLYRRAARRAREVWFLNEHDQGYFEGRGWVSDTPTRVLPSEGVDTEHYAYTPPPENRPLRALFAGRLLRRKGIGEFCEAAHLLAVREVDCRCQVVGFIESANPDALDFDTFQRWIASGTVEYFGETADVRPFITAADVVVLPSTYREGVSRILLEAMAMGRPIIATGGVGIGQLVDEDRNGFRVVGGSAQSLADALTAFSRLPAGKREEMGLRGRHIAARYYDEQFVIDDYHAFVRRLQADYADTAAK